MPLGSLRLAIKSRRKKQQKKYDKNVCKVGGCGKTGYKMRYCMSHYAQVADAMLFTAATGKVCDKYDMSVRVVCAFSSLCAVEIAEIHSSGIS